MVLRWTAAGMPNAQRSFRRPKGYKQRPNSPPALHPHAQRTVIAAPRGALPYTRLSREELGGMFLGLMTYLGPKGSPGDSSMSGNRRTPRRRRGWATGGPA